MSNRPNITRFALFPQSMSVEEQGRRPVIRRYTLTRIAGAPASGAKNTKPAHD